MTGPCRASEVILSVHYDDIVGCGRDIDTRGDALADQEVGCHQCTLLVILHTPILISRALQGLKLARPKWPEQEQEWKDRSSASGHSIVPA